MFRGLSPTNPDLANTVGHSAGLLLFGSIIVLIVRDWRDHGLRQTRLSLIAAVLAFLWNLGSLITLASADMDSIWVRLVLTASFGALSLLPAILFQVVLRWRYPALTLAGYLVSMAALFLHLIELFEPNLLVVHLTALALISWGFGILTVSAVLLSIRDRRSVKGEVGAPLFTYILLPGALLLFTSSFVHFGNEHVISPWGLEVVWHHIGIPVALILLLQDYRFLLLDTFIRFLLNAGLAAFYVTLVVTVGQSIQLFGAGRFTGFITGVELVALCLSLILFAYGRNVLQGWVSKVVFRQPKLEDCVERIARLATEAKTEEDLFARASEEVAQYLRTEHFVIVDEPVTGRMLEMPSLLSREKLKEDRRPPFRAEVQIPLRFSSGDERYLVAGARRGGRRYLSEELESMHRLGAAIVEQVERYRALELRRLVSQAELRALQAQINPHFLFNALNTLYGSIDRKSQDARRMVLNLAEIFRYLLHTDRNTIELSEELRIVEAYLDIEKLRLGDRLKTEIKVSDGVRCAVIPILSIQPLVENAVKHGIAAQSGSGLVRLVAFQSSAGLEISVEDTGPGFRENGRSQEGAGVGLANVRRRLILAYGAASDLRIESGSAGTHVRFLIPDNAGMRPSDTQAGHSGPLDEQHLQPAPG